MSDSLFHLFCDYVDENIFSKENIGETVAFIVDQPFIDDFCKKYGVTENSLISDIRLRLWGYSRTVREIKGLLAIQLYAATKREDSGGITEKNYRERLSQLLNWDMSDLQSWMTEHQEHYWSQLYDWCDSNGFDIAKCYPKTGAGRYVQYPVQQAERVFTLKDLKYIAYHFAQKHLIPGEDIQEKDFWKLMGGTRCLPHYIHSNHGRRLIENPEYGIDAYRQVFNYFLRWDGSYIDYSVNRTARVQKERHFLYIPSDTSCVDIRDDRMKLEEKIDIQSLSENTLKTYYTFKRPGVIIFKKNDLYEDYWEETRYLDEKEEGMAIVFRTGSSSYSSYGSSRGKEFSYLHPIKSTPRLAIYRFTYSYNLYPYYSEGRTFTLEGGLKVGRMQYLEGGAPILSMTEDSIFRIDGELPKSRPIDGHLPLNFLEVGYHDIKFPNQKKIEFEIVRMDVGESDWDSSWNKWSISSKDSSWKSVQEDDGIVGLDFSPIIKSNRHGMSSSEGTLTRWAKFHSTGAIADDEDNIAIRLLSKQKQYDNL